MGCSYQKTSQKCCSLTFYLGYIHRYLNIIVLLTVLKPHAISRSNLLKNYLKIKFKSFFSRLLFHRHTVVMGPGQKFLTRSGRVNFLCTDQFVPELQSLTYRLLPKRRGTGLPCREKKGKKEKYKKFVAQPIGNEKT